MQGLISKDWNEYWLRELYDCIRAEEHDYFYGCSIPSGRSSFGLGWGYKISNEPSNWPNITNQSDLVQINSIGLPLANPEQFIQRPTSNEGSKKLSDAQMFRWFVGRAIPKYESFIIYGNPVFANSNTAFTLDERTWRSITEYRKIAFFSMVYNQGRLGVGCPKRIKPAIEQGDWQTVGNLMKPDTGCGFTQSRGGRNEYVVGRRKREADMVLTNKQSEWVTKNQYHLQDSCKYGSNSGVAKNSADPAVRDLVEVDNQTGGSDTAENNDGWIFRSEYIIPEELYT